MAYHDDRHGHTPIVVGNYYTLWKNYWEPMKLIKVNETTGYCSLRSSNGVKYVSTTELSKWFISPHPDVQCPHYRW